MKKKTKAWYALRRTLPVWSFDENLRELIDFLPQYEIDEIIIKVDSEEFTHGQPPLDWVKKYQAKLFRIKTEMDKLGIVYSLNPWITQGHCDRGRDESLRFPDLQTMVGHDGIQTKSCACPLSDAWRQNISEVWTIYAETKPHVFWVEDDIRTFNHDPISYGCFCPLHMKRFSERVGKNVSREELVAAIVSPGKPHPWRKEFLDMQSEVMIDTVSFLAKVVHQISPDTHMGLMSSDPLKHCLEGRQWNNFAEALADGKKLFSRPTMDCYHENSLKENYYGQDSIKLTRHCLLDNVIEQTEIENITFTEYSKSVNFTFIQMAMSFAFGSQGVTMNLFDHCGTPMENTPGYGRMLKKKKAFLNALAEKSQCNGHLRGVQLLYNEKGSYEKKLNENADYADLSLHDDGFCCSERFESHGIPTVYDNEDLIATAGQTVAAFSDVEIRDMLKKGVFLDAVAAKTIFDRGFGRLIGLKNIEAPKCIDKFGELGAEEFFNEKFGGAEKKFLTLTITSNNSERLNVSLLKPDKNVEVISRLVDPDAEAQHVSMYAFENELGGRVVVHCLELSSIRGPRFNSHFRADQFAGVMKWLSNDKVPLIIEGDGVYPLAFRKDCKDFMLLGMFNFSLDPWFTIRFILNTNDDFAEPLILSQTGQWISIEENINITKQNKKMILEINKEVPFDKPIFLLLEKKK